MWRCKTCAKLHRGCTFMTETPCYVGATFNVVSNRYTRCLSLKRHVMFVWNDIYGQRLTDRDKQTESR